MAQNHLLLPLLPLDERVVLPHMALPVAIESDAARAAIAAAQEVDGLVLLVPRIQGRYAQIGTVAHIEESGRLPDGRRAAAFQGLYRGVLNGAAVERTGALWMNVEPAPDPELEQLPGRAKALAAEYRAILENLLEARGASAIVQVVRSIEHPGQLADMAGYSPDLKLEQQLEILEERDVIHRLEKLIPWSRELLAEASLKEKIRNEVNDGLEKRQR